MSEAIQCDWICMSGSRNFHERGSNENGNFWSQTRGGPTLKKSQNYLFLGKIFKFQGGSGPPVPPSGSAHDLLVLLVNHYVFHCLSHGFGLADELIEHNQCWDWLICWYHVTCSLETEFLNNFRHVSFCISLTTLQTMDFYLN